MKNKKKSIKIVLFYTILLIVTISSMTLPHSHAKYMLDDDKALTYKISLTSLHKGDIAINYTNRTNSDIFFTFSFAKNDIVESLNDKYNVIVKPITAQVKCQVVSINGLATTSIKENNIKATNQVTLKCQDISQMTGSSLKFEVQIEEEIKEKEKIEKFIYLSSSKEIIIPSLPIENPIEETIISEDKLTITIPSTKSGSALYEDFENWVNAYASNAEYVSREEETTAIQNYILNNIKSEEDIYAQKSFPGLKISYENSRYKCEILDNLIGYALTNMANAEKPNYMYFYNETSDTETIFNYYLGTYYKYSSSEKELIQNYISSITQNKGISSIIEQGSINGITYTKSRKRLRLEPSILDFAYNYLNKNLNDSIRISNDTYLNQESMYYTFYENIKVLYPNIDDPIFKIDEESIIYKTLLTSITKNLKYPDITSFKDDILLYNNDVYYKIEITSMAHIIDETEKEYQIENPYNYIKVQKITKVEEIQAEIAALNTIYNQDMTLEKLKAQSIYLYTKNDEEEKEITEDVPNKEETTNKEEMTTKEEQNKQEEIREEKKILEETNKLPEVSKEEESTNEVLKDIEPIKEKDLEKELPNILEEKRETKEKEKDEEQVVLKKEETKDIVREDTEKIENNKESEAPKEENKEKESTEKEEAIEEK